MYRQNGYKSKVITYYSNGEMKCKCCGENDYETLVADHINGGGTKHMKEIGGSGKFYNWLVANNFPPGFRVLCANCNQSYGCHGYCPHTHPSSRLNNPKGQYSLLWWTR